MKRVPQNSYGSNFIKSQPIFKILLSLERKGNSQQNRYFPSKVCCRTTSSLPFESPPLPIFLPLPSSFFSFPHSFPCLRSRLHLIQLKGLGERCKLPQRVRAEPAAKRYLVHFKLKMLVLLAILSIYSRKFTKKIDNFISKTPKKFSYQEGGQEQGPLKYATGY